MSIMISPRKKTKLLRMLHLLWGVINGITMICGAAVFMVYLFVYPEASLKVWQSGLAVMLLGMLNLGVMLAVKLVLKMKE